MTPDRRPTSLELDTLDDRLVPAVVDLTTHAAEGVAGGAIVRQTDAQPTGTGHIHSFLRFQGASSGGGAEQGYNTTARPLQFDENKSPVFTTSVTAGQVPVRMVNGVAYREFLLDINQKSSSSKLSLDELRLYLADKPDLTGYDAATKTLAGNAPVFDMTANGAVTVMLDARLNSGSGSGDMFLLVPDAAFAGAASGTYVYLYSKMGATAGATANSGFEEWAVKTDTSAPSVGLSSLAGTVYEDNVTPDAGGIGVLSDNDLRLDGVIVNLTGVDDQGVSVQLSTTTDLNGNYTFAGLRPGTYTIIETEPTHYIDGVNTVGTAGGLATGDQFMNIVLAGGVDATNYNFGELRTE
jgi:hypothetical protein